ncbi:MAG: plasmid stabilization protein [Dokdonella sp.]|nr:MAG: plasmid stabilization protein [Dokdonella sp.]
MATMTIRNLDEDVKRRLRLQAAQHGRSMEEEARAILRDALAGRPKSSGGAAWVAEIRALVEPFEGIELELPPREPAHEPIDFSGPEYGE